jgi:hypothetical protein
MRAVIIAAKTLRPEVITGPDIFAPKEGDEVDPDFAEKNTGPGKMYPCGQTYTFQGKEVLCFVQHQEWIHHIGPPQVVFGKDGLSKPVPKD